MIGFVSQFGVYQLYLEPLLQLRVRLAVFFCFFSPEAVKRLNHVPARQPEKFPTLLKKKPLLFFIFFCRVSNSTSTQGFRTASFVLLSLCLGSIVDIFTCGAQTSCFQPHPQCPQLVLADGFRRGFMSDGDSLQETEKFPSNTSCLEINPFTSM